MVPMLLVEHGRLFVKLRWLGIFNRCVVLVMLKSWAKTVPVCSRRTLTLGEHRSTPRRLPYDTKALRLPRRSVRHVTMYEQPGQVRKVSLLLQIKSNLA